MPRDRSSSVIHPFSRLPETQPESNSRIKMTRENIKNHFIAFLAEFVGTFFFLFFALAGTKAVVTGLPANKSLDASTLLFISLAFGMSLAVNAWIFYRVSGGLFNPAVTVGLVVVGVVGVLRGVLVVISQLIAGIAAAAAAEGLLPGDGHTDTHLLDDKQHTVVQGFFFELLLTMLLVLTILMLAVEKHRATYVAPVGIGLALFVAEMA